MSERGDKTSAAPSARASQAGDTAEVKPTSPTESPIRPETSASPPPSPRTKGRTNKIYRTPPTPPPEVMRSKEKTFVLDSEAVSSISNDYSKANPKLGPVCPPYNAQKDKHVSAYFSFVSVPKTLYRTGQRLKSADGNAPNLGTSIEGAVMDRFNEYGAGYQYLKTRNQNGAGHSTNQIVGHGSFMEGMKTLNGYNGSYGYRRNTPWLRRYASNFGPATESPLYDPSVVSSDSRQSACVSPE